VTILNRGRYLEDLGLDACAEHTPDGLKKAWKDLCRKHHPDTGGDVEEFHKVTLAYKMLTDEAFAAHHQATTPAKKTSLDVNIQFPITFDEGYFGVTFSMNLAVVEFDEKFEPIKNTHPEIETFRCVIGAGCLDPQPIRFPGRGLRQGDKRGDSLVIPKISSPHPRFQVQKKPDFLGISFFIITQVIVPLNVLLKGGMVKVDTMHGEKEIRIHPGTQPGQFIDIPRSGMICAHQAAVNTKFPDASELKSKKEWEYLGIQWAADDVDTYKDDETIMFEGIWRDLHGYKRRP